MFEEAFSEYFVGEDQHEAVEGDDGALVRLISMIRLSEKRD